MSNLKRELGRALANKRYEVDEDHGVILFPTARLGLAGVFDIQKNDEEIEFFPNTLVDQFRTSALEQLFGPTAKIGTYYLAPYAGNVSPAASWTAANFTANSTEFTNYDEATRQEWIVGAVSSFTISNSASKATFTIAAGAQTTIWGAGLLSASGKSATSGVLVAANKAASARDSLVDGDVITLGYTIALNDAS